MESGRKMLRRKAAMPETWNPVTPLRHQAWVLLAKCRYKS